MERVILALATLLLAFIGLLPVAAMLKESVTADGGFSLDGYRALLRSEGQLARLILRDEFLGLDDNEVNQFEQRIDDVTPEMAKQVIAKHFPLENLTFVLVGKSAEITPMMRTTIRISISVKPRDRDRDCSGIGFTRRRCSSYQCRRWRLHHRVGCQHRAYTGRILFRGCRGIRTGSRRPTDPC